jgi:hypothetical protein
VNFFAPQLESMRFISSSGLPDSGYKETPNALWLNISLRVPKVDIGYEEASKAKLGKTRK